MVNLGSVFWSVEVAEAADAAASAQEVQDEMGKTAKKANQANEAVNKSSQSMGKYSKSTSKSRRTTSRFQGTVGLLSSALFFLGGSMTKLLGISVSLTAAWGTLTTVGATILGWLTTLGAYLAGGLSTAFSAIAGYISSFVGWLAAGSAGALAVAAAIGALIGLAAVFILEWTGILDVVENFGKYLGSELPGVVRDALLALISIFLGPLAVIGGAITGFVRGTLEGGLSEGISRAVERAKDVLNIFAGSWTRLFGGLWDTVQGFLGDLGGVPNSIKSIFGGLGDSLGMELRAAFNAIIPSRLDIPSVTIGGGTFAGQDIPSTTIGGGSLGLPQLQSGGFVEQGGLAALHAGETVVPADVTQNMAQAGGQTGGEGVVIETVNIELGDQSLDLRDLTRSDIRRLADEVAPELGREVENIISP
jgi:hypothetical protein